MANLSTMPPIVIPVAELSPFGRRWTQNGDCLSRSPPYSSLNLGELIDSHVGDALATFLGNKPVITPNRNELIPRSSDSVEVGPSRIVGGVRPQNFDVVYRPDGVRFAYDSKTLNDAESIRKNYQNMINDLATEATTVHSRFPYAIVAFIVAFPEPAIRQPQLNAIIETLERLTGRGEIDKPLHQAEAISFIVWDPNTGNVSTTIPNTTSPLRLEKFSDQVESVYRARYKGLPPHN